MVWTARWQPPILAGVLHVLAEWMQLGGLMRFVSRSVMTGFVNAPAILTFMAQLPELTNVTWQVCAMTAAGLVIIYGLPYLARAVPSPLIAIMVLTALSIALGRTSAPRGGMG